jgi:hypothetical protein
MQRITRNEAATIWTIIVAAFGSGRRANVCVCVCVRARARVCERVEPATMTISVATGEARNSFGDLFLYDAPIT